MRFGNEMEKNLYEVISKFLARLTFGIENLKIDHQKIGNGLVLINFIGSRQECNMRDVSEFLDIPPSSATRKIDKLVKFGLVLREIDPTDRRHVKVSLTSKGKKIFTEFLQDRFSFLKTIESAFTEGELAVLIKMIQKLMELEKNQNIKLDFSTSNA